MNVGLVGLPGSGRKTLFHMLTRAVGSESARSAQVGVLKIPDARLDTLARLHQSRKVTPATIEFVLIPGLVKSEPSARAQREQSESRSERGGSLEPMARRGWGPVASGDFAPRTDRSSRERLDLPQLRTVDVLAHVVRAFDDPAVPHPEETIDPARDAETVELELALADLGVVEGRLEKLQAEARKGRKPARPGEVPALERAHEALARGVPLRETLTAEDRDLLRGYALLTAKPLLLILNVPEPDAARQDPSLYPELRRWTSHPSARLAIVSARIEAEIAELPPEEASVFREDLGLTEGTVERLVRTAFDLTGMATFFTAGEQESRAWMIAKGTPAAQAAGTIHSDMERGFIRAEVVQYDTLLAQGSWNQCRDRGLLRLEGKDYPIADGDVVFFRFNV